MTPPEFDLSAAAAAEKRKGNQSNNIFAEATAASAAETEIRAEAAAKELTEQSFTQLEDS